MWSIHLNVEQQTAIIDDRNGVIIAIRPMPVQSTRFVKKEQILAEPRNLQAWEMAWDLVKAANSGPRMPKDDSSNRGRNKLFKT